MLMGHLKNLFMIDKVWILIFILVFSTFFSGNAEGEKLFSVFHLCDVFSTYFFAAPFFLIFDKIIQFYILNYVCNIGILHTCC